LKYTNKIKRAFAEQLVAPSEDIVRFFASQVYPGTKTKAVLQQFSDLIKRALTQYISDRVTDRLKNAIADETAASSVPRQPAPGEAEFSPRTTDESRVVVTTDEEREAFYVVKSILRETVDPRRIVMRGTASYCGVLLDDNNRKPICRFRFGPNKKILSLFDEKKEENKLQIDDVNSRPPSATTTVAETQPLQVPRIRRHPPAASNP
jgi:hypothetical protein